MVVPTGFAEVEKWEERQGEGEETGSEGAKEDKSQMKIPVQSMKSQGKIKWQKSESQTFK